jgi:hypothetical protein
LAKLHKGTADHHDKMAKLHKARHVEATDQFGSLKKILGSEEAGGERMEEPQPINITSLGTESAIKAAGASEVVDIATTVEKAVGDALAKIIPTLVDKTTFAVMSGLLGEDDTKKALGAKVTAGVEKATGVGDRTELEPVKKGLTIGVMIPKAADTSVGVGSTENPSDKPLVVDMEKVKAGDANEMVNFMKGVRTSSEIPNTLSAQMGQLAGR